MFGHEFTLFGRHNIHITLSPSTPSLPAHLPAMAHVSQHAASHARGHHDVVAGHRLTYMSGFNAEHASEALPGALPVGQNSPQKVRARGGGGGGGAARRRRCVGGAAHDRAASRVGESNEKNEASDAVSDEDDAPAALPAVELEFECGAAAGFEGAGKDATAAEAAAAGETGRN